MAIRLQIKPASRTFSDEDLRAIASILLWKSVDEARAIVATEEALFDRLVEPSEKYLVDFAECGPKDLLYFVDGKPVSVAELEAFFDPRDNFDAPSFWDEHDYQACQKLATKLGKAIVAGSIPKIEATLVPTLRELGAKKLLELVAQMNQGAIGDQFHVGRGALTFDRLKISKRKGCLDLSMNEDNYEGWVCLSLLSEEQDRLQPVDVWLAFMKVRRRVTIGGFEVMEGDAS
jgi:hypothetical protein